MIKQILFFICFLLSIALHSQITIDKSILPVNGDKLKMIKGDPAMIDIGSEGPDQFWNFSHLQGGILQTTSYRKDYDSPGKLLKSFNNNEKNVYVKHNFGIAVLETYRRDPLFGIKSKLAYEPAKLDHPFNLKMNSYFNLEHNYIQYVKKEELPNELKSFLPFVEDSVKIEVECIQAMKVDAWGKMILPKGNNYDVLRLREEITYNASLFILTEGEWTEVDIEAVPSLKAKMRNVTTLNYRFFNNVSKEPILFAEMDNEGNVIKMAYKDTESTMFVDPQSDKKATYLHPNPSFGAINVVFLNVIPGEYQLKVSNILGKKLWESTYNLDQNGIFKENLSFLRKGPYIYSIVGPDGEKLTTRKITIMKP